MPTPPPSTSSSGSETWFTADSVDPEEPAAPSSGRASDELIGATLLDSYKVERVMGEGGMGRIYEAHHTRLTDKRFAIKVLRPELVSSAHIRARFDREVEAVARVSHPGVLSIVDMGTTPLGWPFMVSEYLSGLDLLAYLRAFGPLKSDRVVHLGCCIAEALEATHARGVIHRDIKPSNVFLLGASAPLVPEWDRAKLIDFGLSRFVGRDDQLTKTGIVMGTPAYMAPEQAGGVKSDHLTDIYGVGAVLYAAATGVPPFREKTQQETILALLSRDPVRPRELNASISEGLELVIQRAMAKQAERRYPSMSALFLALSNLEHTLRSPHAGARPRAADAGVPGVRWRIVALATAALVLCLGAVASIASELFGFADLDLRLTSTEQVLIVVLLGAMFALFGAAVHRFWRRSWQDTAVLSDWLPRLRAPVLAALVVYGLASFAVRFGDEVLPRFDWENELAATPHFALPGWGAVLASLALLVASLVAIHQSWWQPMRSGRRWLWGVSLVVVFVAIGIGLGRAGVFARRAASVLVPPEVEGGVASGSTTVVSEALGPQAALGVVPQSERADAGLRARDAAVPFVSAASLIEAQAAPSEPEPSEPEPSELKPSELKPSAAVIEPNTPETSLEPPPLAVVTDTDGVSSPRRLNPEAQALEARALAQAERPSGMAAAVQSIEQLLAVSPASATDPDVRRILRRAASSDGEASREALRVMSGSMGSRGPDLLYDLMLQRPALAERAKHLLTRFRVRALFSPELAIAFDLRFAPSCSSRLGLLPRANEVGDQRAVNTLSELVGKHQRCDGKGNPPCLGPCQREAVRFSRSIDTIVRRLHAAER